MLDVSPQNGSVQTGEFCRQFCRQAYTDLDLTADGKSPGRGTRGNSLRFVPKILPSKCTCCAFLSTEITFIFLVILCQQLQLQ